MTQQDRDRLIEELTYLLLQEQVNDGSEACSESETSLQDKVEWLALQPVSRTGVLRLSRVQERLWVQEQDVPGLWNTGGSLEMVGPLDVEALRVALDGLMERHEPLRTRFIRGENGAPQQIIDEPFGVNLEVRSATRSEVTDQVWSHHHHPFDLEHGPLFRVLLLQLGAKEHIVSLALHHIISDGWSIGVLVQDMRELYQAALKGRGSRLASLKIQYADYAEWQRQQDLSGSLVYWMKTLAEPPAPVSFSTHSLPVAPGVALNVRRLVPKELAEALFRYAREQRASLFMVLLAGLSIVSYRRTRRTDFCLGTTVSGREHLDLEPLIGFFINILPLRMDLSGNPSGTEIIERARLTVLGALEHQMVPFEQLLAEVPKLRQPGGSSAVPIILRHQNFHQEDVRHWAGGLKAQALQSERHRQANSDLDLQYFGDAAELSVTAEYDTARFSKAGVEHLLDELELVLGRLVADPAMPVSELIALSKAEQQDQVVWLAGPTMAPIATSVTELFQEQLRVRPEAAACWDSERSLTYRDLDLRSDAVARALVGYGVGVGERVVLYLSRRVDLVAALLGVWKVRGVYVPVAPDYPDDYATKIIVDVQPRVIVTQGPLEGLAGTVLPEFKKVGASELNLNDLWAERCDLMKAAWKPYTKASAEDLAYIAYTSGSTGEPKGVAVEHSQILNWLGSLWAEQPFAHNEVVAQKTATGFVVHLKEILAGLLAGVPQWIASDLLVRDIPKFALALREQRVTRLNLVPSQLMVLLDHADLLGGLRWVTTAGEPLPEHVRARFASLLPYAELYNNYGMTEINDITYFHAAGPSLHALEESSDSGDTKEGTTEMVPMGRPIANLRLHVLDESLLPVPAGVAGELYVEGASVGAHGYWQRPELTGERWIERHSDSVSATSMRLFRTGDLVRLRPIDTHTASAPPRSVYNLEYLGRADFQVKIRGQKVDPLQVEQVLATHPGIAMAAVMGWNSGKPEALLAAYYVPWTNETDRPNGMASCVANLEPVPDRNALYHWLSQKLPAHLVPAAYIRLEAMPLLRNGKLDRRSLPQPVHESTEKVVYRAPESEPEQALARIWARVLGVPEEQISREDNFFAIGGNSMLAVQLKERLKEESSHYKISVQSILEYPVLKDMASGLGHPSQQVDAWHSLARVLPLRVTGTEAPLFCIHPMIGLSWVYAGLLSGIDINRPVYGIQAKGFAGEPLPREMNEMAHEYIELIRQIQPSGPYHVCGWSFGGYVAHIIATQLQAQGEPIAFLGLLDTRLPKGKSKVRLARPHKDPINRPIIREWALAMLKASGLEEDRVGGDFLELCTDIRINNMDMMGGYTPGIFRGDLFFARATVALSGHFSKFIPQTPVDKWSSYVTGVIRCVDFDADHDSLLCAGEDAALLGAAINKALVSLPHSEVPA
jgi:amino acid adenylation domain-containing protein